jgi:hypothetical protein
MSRIVYVILMIFFAGLVQPSEAKPRKKSCPRNVYVPSAHYKGHKCPPKRKILLAKYY